jgi:hypothetical protein
MNNVIDDYDEHDEHGNLLFKIDYDKRGYYNLTQRKDYEIHIIKKSKTVRSLIDYVSNYYEGDPQVELSDTSEVIFSLEVSDGAKWWVDILDE